MSGFPMFQEVRPSDATFTCIHPCESTVDREDRRCRNRVLKDDRKLAEKLRSKIIQSEGLGEQTRLQLAEYAQLCCCKRSHRSKALKVGRYDEVAVKWLAELVGDSQDVLTMEPVQRAIQRFLPYTSNKTTDPLRLAFSSSLSKRESEDGTLYMIRRTEDPGFVKIGFTQKIADERYACFESSCGFQPIPLRQIRHVPCVRRVERLVHAELNEYRRECTTCAHRTECRTLHAEWFEVKEEQAMAVMKRWASWMSIADPYEIGGELKEFWKEFQRCLTKSGFLPTSEKAMEAWHEQQAQEERLVLKFSRLFIRTGLLQ